MSYDIRLVGAEPLAEPFQEGGTQAIGGTRECELNVTYNYSVMFDFKALHGKTARETAPLLREFSERWKHDKPYTRDYWAPTPGNVREAIDRLRTFAEGNEDCVWEVS